MRNNHKIVHHWSKFDEDGIIASTGKRNDVIFEQAQELFANRPNQNTLSFDVNDSPKWINQVHLEAWKQGIKTLYYMRTESVLRGDIAQKAMEDCISCDG